MRIASRFRVYAATAVSFVLMATTATAAVDMFLQIDNIPGESVDRKHPGTIEVSSFSWGMTNQGASSSGGGGGTGRATFSDFTIMKSLDKSSPLLMLACAGSPPTAKATLYCRKAGGDPNKAQDFYVITLTDVLVTSFTQGGGGDRPTESFSMSYQKIEWTYSFQDAKGVTQTTRGGWDIKNNTAILPYTGGMTRLTTNPSE